MINRKITFKDSDLEGTLYQYHSNPNKDNGRYYFVWTVDFKEIVISYKRKNLGTLKVIPSRGL